MQHRSGHRQSARLHCRSVGGQRPGMMSRVVYVVVVDETRGQGGGMDVRRLTKVPSGEERRSGADNSLPSRHLGAPRHPGPARRQVQG